MVCNFCGMVTNYDQPCWSVKKRSGRIPSRLYTARARLLVAVMVAAKIIGAAPQLAASSASQIISICSSSTQFVNAILPLSSNPRGASASKHQQVKKLKVFDVQ